MKARVACTVTAAMFAGLAYAVPSSAQKTEIEETPISLVGCVMREIDYRKQVGADRGGFLGLGGGDGDEYILVHASRDLDGPPVACGAAGGDAFELTGSAEEDVEPFLGQRVVLTGIVKEADIDPATGRPDGGNKVGADLRLFEVNVETIRAWVAPPPEPVAALELPAAIPEPAPEQPVATSGVEPTVTLPRTASPRGFAALLGLLALAGAAGVRVVRSRRTA